MFYWHCVVNIFSGYVKVLWITDYVNVNLVPVTEVIEYSPVVTNV